MQINDETSSAIETIRIYQADISASDRKLKTLNEQIQEELESMNEYDAVIEAEKTIAEVRAKLRQALKGNSRYNDLLEEKAQTQETRKDQKGILSDHLVAYFALTQERQIELGPDGDAREVILTGKLGKEQKYQESLFKSGNDRSYEISDGESSVKITDKGIETNV